MDQASPPGFVDTGPVFDPQVHLDFVASRTTDIEIGTAASVGTLGHPVPPAHAANRAASIDPLASDLHSG